LVPPILETFDIGSYTPENATALPCEMQNVFNFLRVYDIPQKLDNFEKQPVIMASRNLNFRQPVSLELLKVTIVCVIITLF